MNNREINRKTMFTVALCFLMLMAGCKKEEYLDVDVSPQLEITVVDISNNRVQGATVTLYYSEADWELKNNMIQKKVTDTTGKVLFKELNEVRYYFYVEKDTKNNFYEVVTFSNPLKKNEIKAITCVIK